MLEAWGVLSALHDDDAPEQARTGLTTAGWFHRLVRHGMHPETRCNVELLVACKERLLAEGVPLKLYGHWQAMDIDMLETCLAHDIPVDLEGTKLGRLVWWGDKERMGVACDPVHVAKDPVLRDRFIDALHSDAYWADSFERLMEGRPAFKELMGAWLERLLDRSEERLGLPGTFEVLKTFKNITAGLWTTFPESAARFRRFSFGAALATTLNIGLLDEFEWPALEAVKDEHFPKGGQISDAFPYVTLYSNAKAVVIGPDEKVLIDHDVRVPAGKEISRAFYSQGDLVLVFSQWYDDGVAYWVSAPSKVIDKWDAGYIHSGILLEDGRVLYGGSPLAAGDTRAPTWRGHVYSDGQTFWLKDDEGVMRRYDPLAQTRLATEKPPFIEPTPAHPYSDGWVLPCPDPTEGSPVQTEDGVMGLRWYKKDDVGREMIHGSDILGRSFSFAGDNTPAALLTFPGASEPRLLTIKWRGFQLLSEDGLPGSDSYAGFCGGGAFFHSPRLLARYVPRDVAGSEALRTLTKEKAAALIAAAKAKPFVEGSRYSFDPDAGVLAAIGEHLPQISHPKLKKAIAGVLGAVAAQQRRLDTMLAKLPDTLGEDSSGSYRPPPRKKGHKELQPALMGLVSMSNEENTFFSEMSEVRGFFEREDPQDGDAVVTENGMGTWEALIGNVAAVAYRMVMPKVKGADRTVLREFAQALAEHGFSGPDVSKRYRLGPVTRRLDAVDKYKPTFCSQEGNDYYAWRQGSETIALEYARSGEFKEVDGPVDVLGSGWGNTEQLAELWGLFEEKGAIPLKEAIPHVCELTGLTPTEATLFATAEWDTDVYNWVKAKEFAWAQSVFRQPHYGWRKDVPRIEFAAAIVEAGPIGELWDAAKLAERIAEQFLRDNPVLQSVQDETMLTEIEHAVSPSLKLSLFARGVGHHPAHRDESLCDDRRRFFKGIDYESEGDGFAYPRPFVEALLYGFFQSKAGDPFFRGIGGAWERLRQRLEHPHYLTRVMHHWGEADKEPLKSSIERFSGKPEIEMIAGEKDDGNRPVGDSGVCLTADDRWVSVYATTRAILDGHALLDGLLREETCVDEVRFIFSEQVDAFIARSKESPLDADAYEADPRHSAPQAVSGLMELHGIGKDAAGLYLQLATLLLPTDAMVCRYNGWNKKQLVAAGKELVQKELVIEAKRAKAGRSLFIPSAWETKELEKPFESWKNGHLELLDEDGDARERPFDYIYELWPPHILYARVWERIEKGDGPSFEEPPR